MRGLSLHAAVWVALGSEMGDVITDDVLERARDALLDSPDDGGSYDDELYVISSEIARRARILP